jgi:hypothetical protein
VRLRTDRILEEWSQLLPECAGEAPRIMADVQARLKATNVMGMNWSEESLASGYVIGVLGRRRDCVRIQHAKFPEVVVIAGAYDHGTNLLVFWIAAARPRLLGRIRRALRFGADSERCYEIAAELDLIQAWALGAFLETTRIAVRRPIADLLSDRKPPARRRRARP